MKPYKILLVDDEINILKALARLLRQEESYEIYSTSNPSEARKYLDTGKIDLIMSDERMPGIKGRELLRYAKQHSPDTIRIILTAYADMDAVIDLINEGEVYRYLTKPWDDRELLMIIKNAFHYHALKKRNKVMTEVISRQNLELKQLNDKLEEQVAERTKQLQRALINLKKKLQQEKRNFLDTIYFNTVILSTFNREFVVHSMEIANLTEKLCRTMKLKEEEIEVITSAALLHDIGLIDQSPEFFKTDPKKLPHREKALFNDHTFNGEILLCAIPNLEEIPRIIRSHHEAWDGSGFPEKLWGKRIPLGARIIRIVEDYNNLIITEGKSTEKAIELMVNEYSPHYDPEILTLFIKSIQNKTTSPLLVKIKNLKATMIIGSDIILENKMILFKKGKKLTAKDIEIIQALQKILSPEKEISIIYEN